MSEDQRLEQLLECLIQVVARAAISEDKIREIVETGAKQVTAFNLCDGTRTLVQIAGKARLDRGNLSRAASRWVQGGAAFWIGEGKDARLLHVFPIAPKKERKRRSPKARRKARS